MAARLGLNTARAVPLQIEELIARSLRRWRSKAATNGKMSSSTGRDAAASAST